MPSPCPTCRRHCKLALGGLAGREDVVHESGQLSLGDVDAVVDPLIVEAQSTQRVHRAAQVDQLLAAGVAAAQRRVQPRSTSINARLQLQRVVEPFSQRVAFTRQRHLANATEIRATTAR